jgi:dTDP-N-acetylfucosamine:lipid II N-acetylfucosaminyltransferase
MKFLHLVPDNKFIPFIQGVYEIAFPGCSEYRVIGGSHRGPRFVKPAYNVKHVSKGYWFSRELCRDVTECDCLVVHQIKLWFAPAILRAPKNVLVVWYAWGSDYYPILESAYGSLLLPQTLLLMREIRLSGRNVGAVIRRGIKKTIKRLLAQSWLPLVAKRIDIVSMDPLDLERVRRVLPGLKAIFHQLHCYSAEDVFSRGPERIEGPDILLGNSATPTNNHLDAFDVLRKLDLEGRKIVVPLSYGDMAYADAVCKSGTRLFGPRFHPLRNFMPIDEYYEAIASCGTVIMNHIRQQAVGSISAAMFKGARVYLRPENPLYSYFGDMGLHFSRMPVEAADEKAFFAPLSEAQKIDNRRILESFWSIDSVVRHVSQLADFADRKNRNVQEVMKDV